MKTPLRVARLAVLGLLTVLLAGGCATARLETARRAFYDGDFASASSALSDLPNDNTDGVLTLMERGMIRQAAADYRGSIEDWLAAVRLIEDLDYYSVSRGTASMAVNDRVRSFRGALYERVLLRSFAAKSYLAQAQWDDAAVEARNAIGALERRDKYPDDPYTRYLAGVCLELQGDTDGAAVQYRTVAALLPELQLDPRTGRFGPPPAAPRQGPAQNELICFVLLGRAPTGSERDSQPPWRSSPSYAELSAGGRVLGRSFVLENTGHLMAQTERQDALAKTAKTAARIAAKEAMAQVLSQQNEALGEILRLILFALETPDERCWETLPYWLQVARVPCPDNLTQFELVVKTHDGRTQGRRTIARPLNHRGNLYVSFCRDL